MAITHTGMCRGALSHNLYMNHCDKTSYITSAKRYYAIFSKLISNTNGNKSLNKEKC